MNDLLENLHNQLPLFLILSGGLIVVFEAFIPGGPFFVTGFAILGSGIIGFVTGISEPWVLGIFAIASSIPGLLVYRYMVGISKETDQSTDASDLKGATGTVTQTITEQGSGEIYLSNAKRSDHYRARSNKGIINEGAKVKVVDPRGGSLLLVEAVDDE